MANQTTPAIQVKDSNVGIGTSSPAFKLDVSGTFHSGGDATFNGTNTYINSSYIYVGNNTADLVSISGNTMYFPGNGNVGIGTTAPGSILTVAGAGGSTLGTNGYIVHIGGTDGNVDPVRYMIGFSHGNTYTAANVRAAIGMMVTTGGNGNLVFETGAAGAGQTERMRINGNGNVGIGTTAPYQSKLHVTKSESGATPTAVLRVGNQGAGYTSRIILTDETTNDANISYLGATQSLGFGLGTSLSQMVLTSTGNVGIGTTSPFNKLTVGSVPASGYGLITISADWASGSAISTGIKIGAAADTGGAGVDIRSHSNYAASSGTEMSFWTNSTGNVLSERMRITAAGNVGINSTAASVYVLDVFSKDTAYNTRLYQPSTATDTYVSLIVSGAMTSAIGYFGAGGSTTGNPSFRDNVVVGSQSNHPLVLNTNDAERMRITSGGAVGINTTNPTQLLQVAGNETGASKINALGTVYGSGSFLNAFSSAGGNDVGFAGFIASQVNQTNRMWTGVHSPSGANQAFIGTPDSMPLAFWTNSAEQMRITAAGNVGIGTTAPTTLLQVASSQTNSSIRTGGLEMQSYAVNNSWYAENVYFDGSSWRLRSNGYATQMYMQGGTIDFNRVATGAAGDAATLLTTIRLNNTGNVLIGTTADAGYKLRVNGTSYFDGLAHFGQTATSGSAFRWGAFGTAVSADTMLCMNQLWNGSGWTILEPSYGTTYVNLGSAVASPDIQFGTGPANTEATTKMIIKNGGNVGIGITSPSYRLSINGDAGIEGSESYLYFHSSATVGSNARARMRAVGAGGGSGYGGDLRIDTRASNNVWNENVVTVSNNGNVGIGTTSPASRLHVYSGASSSTAAANAIAIFEGSSNGVIQVNGPDASSMGLFFGRNGAAYYSGIERDGTNLYLKNNSSVGLSINSSNNVGIGTTAPSYKLDVSGTIRAGVAGNSSANIPALLVTSSGTGDAQAAIAIQQATSEGDTIIFADYEPYVEWGISTENAANKIQFTAGTSTGSLGSKTLYNNAGNARTAYIKFDHDLASGQTLIGGNVGIGTTAPATTLDVNGTISSGGSPIAWFSGNYNRIFRPNGAVGIYLGNDTDQGNYYDNTTHYFRSSGGGTTYAVINSSGLVGIGTTSPTEKLHVDGSVVVTYNNAYQGINSIGNKAILARVSPTTGIINYAEYATAANLNGFVMGSDDARVKGNIATDSLEFITNGSTQVTVLSNGNVGIANTNPSEKLSVTGNIRMDNGTADGPQLVLGSSGFSDWNIDNFSGSLRAYYGSTEYTRLTSSGNFGIGVSPSYKLDVAGDTRITSGSLGVGVVPNATDGRIDASNDIVAYSSSDRRLKENITPIANALDKVKSLNGVEFDWKPEHKKAHGYEGHDTGVIAQEVQEVMPTAVRTNDTGYLAVRYEKLIGLLIEANKELAARVEELENKLK